MEYTPAEQLILLHVAMRSIESGFTTAGSAPPADDIGQETLNGKRASFVTLTLDGNLRGCIGSIEATRSLLDSVAANAFSAAFRDPRFPPLEQSELGRLLIQISVLGPLKPVVNTSESELIRQLRPGIDGCLLTEGNKKGVFLPSVWASIPKPEHFVQQLKIKTGLSANYWSDDVEAWCYTTESFTGLAADMSVIDR